MSAKVSKKQQRNIQPANANNVNVVDDANAVNTAMIAQIAASQFSGPIPPPEILSGYENIQVGFADRVIKMAENQSEHRQKLEATKLKYDGRDSLLGIVFAFIICMTFIIAGVYVIVNVPDGKFAGTILSTVGIGSIITSFIKTTRTNNKDK